jgi:NADPH2:quinone reductase
MRALTCPQYGPPERLAFADVPAPTPAPGEVVVEVRCCAVSFFDTLFLRGLYQIKPPLPFIPGAEVAGVIAEVGADAAADAADCFRPGDRVIALTWTGGLAERVRVGVDELVRLPDTVGFDAGAAMVMAYGTAALALDGAARLGAGETVLVLGGGGGVGGAAIDIAKARGSGVIAAASGAEKLARCRALGADHGIDYGVEDLKTAIRDRFGTVDVIFDPLGGDFTEAALRCIAKGGRHLIIGFAAGAIPRIPMNLPLLKQASIVGVDWGDFSRRDPAASAALNARLMAEVEVGRLSPRAGRSYPFADAVQAFRDVMSRTAVGRSVVEFR